MSTRYFDCRWTSLGIKWVITLWFAASLAIVLDGCSTDDYKHLPEEIQQFIDQYFPGQGVANYSQSAGTYTVNLENSASIVFNQSLDWTTVDGNGSPLPEEFVYDNFPQTLYEYIETTGNLKEVYSVSRNAGIYTVTFHDYIIAYNVATETITPVTDGQSS